jgi:hypothetical protein
METPLALQIVGVPDLPIYLHVKKLRKIQADHPEMTRQIMGNLPAYLADPMIIFKSDTVPGRIVVVLELKDSTGINIVVPMELNAHEGRIEINVMVSAYGRGMNNHQEIQYPWFIDNIKAGNTLYINKKQAAEFYQSAGLQLPMKGKKFNDLFGSSIKTNEDLVKLKSVNPTMYQMAGTNARTAGIMALPNQNVVI